MEVATFDGITKVATLTISGDVNVRDLYSAAIRWLNQNPQFLNPFDASGGELQDPSQGIYTPIYIRCVNGWRIKAPFSCNIVGGILMVDGGGGSPFIEYANTVQIQYKSPIEAIAFSTGSGGGGSGNFPTAAQIAAAVRAELSPELSHLNTLQNGMGLDSAQATMLLEIYRLYGLDPTRPLVVTDTSRTVGEIYQTISSSQTSTTIVRR